MTFLMIASYLPSLLIFRGDLLAALHEAGLTIHIAAPDTDQYRTEHQKLEAFGYRVHDIPMQRTGTNPAADIKTSWALYRLMRRIRPDYVLAYTIKPVIYGMMAAARARVPHRFALITGLGYAFQDAQSTAHKRSTLQHLTHKLYKTALVSANTVFFQNPDDEALFKALNIVSANHNTVVVKGSGVNTADFSTVSLPMQRAHPAPRFLLIARLLGDKGVREYAQAAKMIKNKYPQAHFDLVGWIDDNPDAIAQSELDEWINEGVVRFLGKLDDVKPAITDSSVYVLPSYREGTPRTVLEAMAMGRAIITTDAPGCRETVIDGHNGYMVAVKSVDALVTAMERLITHPELIAQMGKASRQLVEQHFDVHAVNQVMLHNMGI